MEAGGRHTREGEWLVFDGQFARASTLKIGLLPHDFRMTREPGEPGVAQLLPCSFPLEHLAHGPGLARP